MKMKFFRQVGCCAAGFLLAGTSPAAASIYLTGTDAWSYHKDDLYAGQLAALLGPNIAYINNFGIVGPTTVAGVSVTGFSSLPASLTGFTGVFFASPGTCCGDPATAGLGIATGAAQINAFLAAGGNLAIEDFSGNAAWDSILGFSSSGHVFGTLCDPGVSTAAGIAAGFTGDGGTGTYTDGCFQHQSYDTAFFATKGYVSYINDSTTTRSVFLALTAVPEPSTWAMMLLGFAGLGVAVRRSNKAATKQLA